MPRRPPFKVPQGAFFVSTVRTLRLPAPQELGLLQPKVNCSSAAMDKESAKLAYEYLATLKESNIVNDSSDGGWVGIHMVDAVRSALQSTAKNIAADGDADNAGAAGTVPEEEADSDDSSGHYPLGL